MAACWYEGHSGAPLRECHYKTPYSERAIMTTYFLVLIACAAGAVTYFLYLLLARGHTTYHIDHPTWPDVRNRSSEVIQCSCLTSASFYASALFSDATCTLDGSTIKVALMLRARAFVGSMAGYWSQGLTDETLTTAASSWGSALFDSSSSLSAVNQTQYAHYMVWALLVCSADHNPYMQTYYRDLQTLYDCNCDTTLCAQVFATNVWPNTSDTSALNCTFAKSHLDDDHLAVVEGYLTWLAANATERTAGTGMSAGLAAAISSSLQAVASFAMTTANEVQWTDLSIHEWRSYGDYSVIAARHFEALAAGASTDGRVITAVGDHYHLHLWDQPTLARLALNAFAIANSDGIGMIELVYQTFEGLDLNETFFEWCRPEQCLHLTLTRWHDVILRALGTISVIFAVGWIVGRQALRVLSTKSCCLYPNVVDWDGRTSTEAQGLTQGARASEAAMGDAGPEGGGGRPAPAGPSNACEAAPVVGERVVDGQEVRIMMSPGWREASFQTTGATYAKTPVASWCETPSSSAHRRTSSWHTDAASKV